MAFQTLGNRLKTLRRDIGFSQEAVGAQGFVSTPGWIKIENGQRQASERLIEKLVAWLVKEKHIKTGASDGLKEELLTLKYMGSSSKFIRDLTADHASKRPSLQHLLLPIKKPEVKRGRPVMQRIVEGASAIKEMFTGVPGVTVAEY